MARPTHVETPTFFTLYYLRVDTEHNDVLPQVSCSDHFHNACLFRLLLKSFLQLWNNKKKIHTVRLTKGEKAVFRRLEYADFNKHWERRAHILPTRGAINSVWPGYDSSKHLLFFWWPQISNKKDVSSNVYHLDTTLKLHHTLTVAFWGWLSKQEIPAALP